MPAPADRSPLGLRERKKARTRAQIQAEALRLIQAQGYEATTVEQIAEAAEVSESTFFRYFPAKADVVLWDEFDPLIAEAFTRQPPELRPIPALRAAFRSVFGEMTPKQRSEQDQRTALILSVPELRAAMLDQLAQPIELLTEMVAERTGRAVDDLAVRTLAGAVVGAAMAIALGMGDRPDADFATMLDEALAHLEAGLSF